MDARDLAPGCSTWPRRPRWRLNAIPGRTGDLGRVWVERRAARAWVGDPAWIEAEVEEPWDELPLWPIPSLPGLYRMSGAAAAATGLAPRPLGETIADTWSWLAAGGTLDDWRTEVRASGLSAEVERRLLAALRS